MPDVRFIAGAFFVASALVVIFAFAWLVYDTKRIESRYTIHTPRVAATR